MSELTQAWNWVQSRRMEDEAERLTLAWMKADPFYRDAPQLTPRERAILKLGLRMMTHPQEYPASRHEELCAQTGHKLRRYYGKGRCDCGKFDEAREDKDVQVPEAE